MLSSTRCGLGDWQRNEPGWDTPAGVSPGSVAGSWPRRSALQQAFPAGWLPQEGSRREAGAVPTRGRLARPHRASHDRPALVLASSGNEVLEHLRTARLTPSVSKPPAGRGRNPKRAVSARDEARDRWHKHQTGVKSQAKIDRDGRLSNRPLLHLVLREQRHGPALKFWVGDEVNHHHYLSSPTSAI